MRSLRISMMLGVLVIMAAAIGGGLMALGGLGGAEPAAAGETKVIHMTALEYKGSTNSPSESFPGVDVPAGGGYKNIPPCSEVGPGEACYSADDTLRWGTQTYRYEPATIVVNKGDDVLLKIWGVNGSAHPTTIERFVPEIFTPTRGELTEVEFTADKAGSYKMTCLVHGPSMETWITVLPFPDKN